MPRYTKNSNMISANGCAALGDCWSERELKAQVRAAKKLEKEEAAKKAAEEAAEEEALKNARIEEEKATLDGETATEEEAVADEAAGEKKAVVEEVEAVADEATGEEEAAAEEVVENEAADEAAADAVVEEEEEVMGEVAEEVAEEEVEAGATAEEIMENDSPVYPLLLGGAAKEDSPALGGEEQASHEILEGVPVKETDEAHIAVDANAYTTDATDADAADGEVAAITAIVVYEPPLAPIPLHAEEALAPTPVVSKKGGDTSDEEEASGAVAEAGPSSSDEAQMILYAIKKVSGKRPQLEIYDAKNDPNELSSKKVKKCVWVSDNVPASVKGIWYTPNQALISLRNALDPSKREIGSNGINAKVNLCTNADGPPQTVKRMAQTKQLHKFLMDA
jgi:hypothetical protein